MNRIDAAAALFERLCDLPAEAQAAELARLSGDDDALRDEVRALLDADRDPGSRLRGLAVDADVEPSPSPERADSGAFAIPGFRILSKLGQGGMGSVFEAEQERPHRIVALKVLRPDHVSSETRRRFEREADALARLRHPCIATIFETGVAVTEFGALPWFAMELVRGRTLTEDAGARGLDTRARLELLAAVSDAIEHAHGHGVLHRDLKPSNILVDEDGRPRVLDFGVARVTGSDLQATTLHTYAGQVIGTLAYMSPEQASGDPDAIDERSDVYSLGVLAFELLARELPYDLGGRPVPEALRVVLEEDATHLGTLDRSLRGDVETIVAKALEKEKEHRYASAAALSADLRRYLKNEPILARPPTRTYQLRKFARRNKALVAGVAGVFLVLLTGTVTTTVMYLQKTRLYEEKRDEVIAAEQTVAFLEGLFEQADPMLVEELTVEDVTRRAATRIANELRDRPAVRGRLLNVLGSAFNQMGLEDQAVPLLEEALVLRAAELGEDSLEYADTLKHLSRALHSRMDLDRALPMARRALAIREAQLGDSAPTAEALSNLGSILRDAQAYDEAEACLERAHAMQTEASFRLETRLDLAGIHVVRGQLGTAKSMLRSILDTSNEEGLSPGLRIFALHHLGHVLRTERKREEAEALQREALRLCQTHYGDGTAMGRLVRRELANVLTDQGRVPEAVALMRELRDELVARLGRESFEAAGATHDLAYAVHELPDNREAEGLYRDAIDGFRWTVGPEAAELFMAQHNLALFYEGVNRLEEAEELERLALEGRTRTLGEGHDQTLASLYGLALILSRRGRIEEAVELRTRLLDGQRALYGDAYWFTQRTRLTLARNLIQLEQYEAAEPLLELGYASLSDMDEPDDSRRQLLQSLVELYRRTGQTEKLEHWRELEAREL